jgi:hypothetical protein
MKLNFFSRAEGKISVFRSMPGQLERQLTPSTGSALICFKTTMAMDFNSEMLEIRIGKR